MEVLIENRDFDGLKKFVVEAKNSGQDNDFLLYSIDSLIRQRGLRVTVCPAATIEEMARRHLSFIMEALSAGLCTRTLPIIFLQDIFETNELRTCEVLFSILEEHMKYFKQENMFEPCKMVMIRICNDLLRRLSRTADAPFCGRILFFLSRYLPLYEKSGLNINGAFNVNNTTKFDQEEIEGESLMSVDTELESGELQDESKEIEVTHDFYKTFWSFQQFLSNPPLIFEKEKYPIFKKDLNSILSLMIKNKLDKAAREKNDDKITNPEVFFSKYLTSQKLLPLQLNDPRFRQYFLLQCLIVMQYLKSDIKTKNKAIKLSLTEEQKMFVDSVEEKCWRLITDTHENGFQFIMKIRNILHREVSWNSWKFNSCADVSEKVDKQGMVPYIRRPKTSFDPAANDLGNAELTKLWSGPSLLESCADKKRKFAPDLEQFLEDPLDEMDPEQQVEEEYKSLNEPGFCWRASRFLLTTTTHYIPKKDGVSGTDMKSHLESAIYNTAKTMDKYKEQIAEREIRDKLKEEQLKVKKEECSASPNAYTDLNDDILADLAKELTPEVDTLVKALAVAIKQDEDEKDQDYCLRVLKEWSVRNSHCGKTFRTKLLSHPELLMSVTTILKKYTSISTA